MSNYEEHKFVIVSFTESDFYVLTKDFVSGEITDDDEMDNMG